MLSRGIGSYYIMQVEGAGALRLACA